MIGFKKAALAACALMAVAVGTASATMADAKPGAAPEGDPARGTIEIGGRTSGSLAASDGRLDSGEYVDRYTFQGRRGQRVAIELESSDFDTYVILVPPSGRQQDNDDSGQGESTNSRLETALPEDGEYQLMVTSFRPGEAGRYALSVQPSQGSARQAAAPSGPRVFALFVGVSDYDGRYNDLPDTDGDAKGLALQMEQAGVLNPASIVLTNGEATRAAVRAAFQRLAAQAGPQDTFLFFFSGHGDRNAASGTSELDGQTETLELADGALTDAELAQMFSTLRTRLSVVALDSCFSGGFDNVVSRPNVMGIFSSEEDLTSQVASTYNAGGYLSHFLTAGMSGEADEDGDAMLTAGELAAYLRRSFREEGDIPASTGEGVNNYQNLVISRGGVSVDDVLYRLERRG